MYKAQLADKTRPSSATTSTFHLRKRSCCTTRLFKIRYVNLLFRPDDFVANISGQTATAEGGPNWVEYLTGCGLKPGLTSPLSCKTQLWDFAFGGADISTK